MKRKKKLQKPKPTGKKFDNNKIRLDLIPSESIEEIGRVLTFGCIKYGQANWAEGIHYSRLIAAAKRHISTWEKCEEDIDPETNTSHIANAATNLLFLLWMIKNRPDLDDRWQKKFKKK